MGAIIFSWEYTVFRKPCYLYVLQYLHIVKFAKEKIGRWSIWTGYPLEGEEPVPIVSRNVAQVHICTNMGRLYSLLDANLTEI